MWKREEAARNREGCTRKTKHETLTSVEKELVESTHWKFKIWNPRRRFPFFGARKDDVEGEEEAHVKRASRSAETQASPVGMHSVALVVVAALGSLALAVFRAVSRPQAQNSCEEPKPETENKDTCSEIKWKRPSNAASTAALVKFFFRSCSALDRNR